MLFFHDKFKLGSKITGFIVMFSCRCIIVPSHICSSAVLSCTPFAALLVPVTPLSHPPALCSLLHAPRGHIRGERLSACLSAHPLSSLSLFPLPVHSLYCSKCLLLISCYTCMLMYNIPCCIALEKM